MICSGGHLEFSIGIKTGLSLTLDPMGKMFQNASSLKPLGQLNPNCPGMIIGRSSTKFLFFYEKRYAMSYMDALPDFVKLAESYGHIGIKVEKEQDLKPALINPLCLSHQN
jgi:acetolactate synthase-1/2/3 large subunit